MARILAIDDEADLLRALNMILKSRGHEVTALSDALTASNLIQNDKFDLIISDIRMQPMDGLQLLDFLRQSHVKTPVIMLTAHATLDVALQAIKKGAFDFITKPFKPDALLAMIQQVIEQPVINGSDIALNESLHAQWIWNGVMARSHQMQDVCNCLKQIAPTNETIMLMGEEGTGKRFIAEIIHSLSPRAGMSLQALDCAKLNQNDYAAVLFGSEPKEKSIFDKNTGGTILLENIDYLPQPLGEKLAHIIHSKIFTPLNAQPIQIDARFLVSCGKKNKPISWIQNIAAFTVSLPALRERAQDILPLISWQIQRQVGDAAKEAAWIITADAYKMLAQYPWPRNVDELNEMLDNAMKSAKGRKLTPAEFPSIHISKVSAKTQTIIDSVQPEDLRGRSFRDYVRRKQMEIKEQ